MAKLYYVRNPDVNDPYVDQSAIADFKVGISGIGSARTRFNVYQNALPPRKREQWLRVWIGSDAVIERELEPYILNKWDDNIISREGGESEWISGVTFNDLVTDIENTIQGLCLKVKPVPAEFLPLTVDRLPELREWYKTA